MGKQDSITLTTSAFRLNEDDIVVFLVGPWGRGKSSFVNEVTKSRLIQKVGTRLPHSTVAPQAIRCSLTGEAKRALKVSTQRNIVFVDTPSFHTSKNDGAERVMSSWLSTSRSDSKSKLALVGTIYMHRVETDPADEPIQLHLNAFASTFPHGFVPSPQRLHAVLSHSEGRISEDTIERRRAAFQTQLGALRQSPNQGGKLRWHTSLDPNLFQLGASDPETAWQAVVQLFSTTRFPSRSHVSSSGPIDTPMQAPVQEEPGSEAPKDGSQQQDGLPSIPRGYDEPPEATPAFQLNEDDIVVFLVGPSGSGKSLFINELAKSGLIMVGTTLRSFTVTPQAIRCELTEEAKYTFGASIQRNIVFVDTPSFHTDGNDGAEREMSDWLSKSKLRLTLVGTIYTHRVETDPVHEPIQPHLDSFARTFPRDFHTLPQRLHGVLSYEGVLNEEKIKDHRATFQAQLDALRPSRSQGNQLKWRTSLHPDLFGRGNHETAWQAVVALFSPHARTREERESEAPTDGPQQQDEQPSTSGDYDNQSPEEQHTTSSPPESETHSGDGEDALLEVELPPSKPPPQFNCEEPPSPASSPDHREVEVMPTSTSQAISQLPAAPPVTSSAEACAEDHCDTAESSATTPVVSRWRFKKTNKSQVSHPSRPGDPRSRFNLRARFNTANEQRSTMAAGHRVPRAVGLTIRRERSWFSVLADAIFRPASSRQRDTKAAEANQSNKDASGGGEGHADAKKADPASRQRDTEAAEASHSNKDASGGGEGYADPKKEDPALQVYNPSQPPAGRINVARRPGVGTVAVTFEFPAWMCCSSGTEDAEVLGHARYVDP